jgi:hypothetical protein
MRNLTKIALSTAIVLGAALTAAAATGHHRTVGGRSPIYNSAPGIITDACQPVGPPCRTQKESW